MAKVIVTLKVMPESPDVDLEKVSADAQKIITAATASVEIKQAIEPVAFGLKAVVLTFIADEEKGSVDDVEKQVQEIAGVQSTEVTDVRRAVG